MSSKEIKLAVPKRTNKNMIGFELKSCDVGMVTLMSELSSAYHYDILIDGLVGNRGRSVYIVNKQTSNVTNIELTKDTDDCNNYRFYWIQVEQTETIQRLRIDQNFTEYLNFELQNANVYGDSGFLFFYTVLSK